MFSDTKCYKPGTESMLIPGMYQDTMTHARICIFFASQWELISAILACETVSAINSTL